MLDNTTSAYDLVFHFGYDNQRVPYGALDSRTFFDFLRKRIVTEYKDLGYCKLINSLREQNRNIDIIVYAAIVEAKNILEGQPITDIFTRKYVPHCNVTVTTPREVRKICWDDCVYINQFAQYQSPSMIRSLLRDVIRSGEDVHKALQRERSKKGSKIDLQTEDQAQAQLADAQYQAQKILSNARAEAEQIVAQAHRQAQEVIEQAQALVEQARAEAKAEAARISAISDVTAESGPTKQTLETPVKQYFAQDWEELKQSYEKELSAMRKENQEVSAEIERVHDRMVDQTNSIQREITASISSAVEDISNMREELYKKLQNWQTSLFPREYEPLAQRYVELYRIINISVKRLLVDEASFQYAQPDGALRITGDSGDAYSISNTSDSNGKTEAAPATLVGLQKLHKTLTIFLQKFETAMKGVGLYVFSVEKGTAFDEVQHMVENDDMDPEGRTIVRCIVPGVAKKAIDAEEDDIVIRATVEL